MTLCAVGGLPIPEQPWQVRNEDGELEPMCEVHSIAVDLGRALDESVGLALHKVEKYQAFLRELLDDPCPQPRPESPEQGEIDDEARRLLDDIWKPPPPVTED